MIKRHNYWHEIIKIVAFSLFFFAMLCCSFSVKMGCIYGRGTSSILVASCAHCVDSFYMWEIKKIITTILILWCYTTSGFSQNTIKRDTSNVFSNYAMREMLLQVDNVIHSVLSEQELNHLFNENKKDKKNAIFIKITFNKTGSVIPHKSEVSLYKDSDVVSKATLKKIKNAIYKYSFKIIIQDSHGDGHMTRVQYYQRYKAFPVYSLLYPTSVIQEFF